MKTKNTIKYVFVYLILSFVLVIFGGLVYKIDTVSGFHIYGYGYGTPSSHPPALFYSQDAGYIDDGINPNEGNSDTDFTFKIIYTDADNDVPTNLSVFVYNGGTATSTLLMSPDTDVSINPILRDGNYQNGEQYTAVSTFSEGNYSYVFQTVDINNGGQSVLFPTTATPTFTVDELIPVIIVPGIVGSRLFDLTANGKEVWLDLTEVINSPDDHELDLLKLTDLGEKPQSEAGITPLDVIRRLPASDPVYYYLENLIASFKNSGYEEGRNLFVAPYDWRLNLSEEVNRLSSKIATAISHSPTGKIDIVAHSLGGLLVKTYLNQLSDASFVNNLILIGSPQLGAPKAFKALNYGDNLGFSLFGKDILNTDRVK
ncbi:MAG: hypothetical protein AAB944_01055, partial [Patescibacteria group bacterium]